MKKLHAGIGTFLGGLLALTPSAQDTASPLEPPTVVVGTFDSRAVLMAYVRSDAFTEYVSAQKADVGRALDRAKSFGDKELVADLDALGPAMQKRIHQQGFGTAPVDDVLARIANELPAIAEKAGVDVIVSKWSLAYRKQAARLVDVTDPLVAAFHPSEETLKGIRNLVATDPIPLDRIEEDR